MANQINRELFLENIFSLLEETFENTKGIYLDKATSLFDSLHALSAEFASLEVNKNTIAAHVEHIRFYLVVLKNYMNGDKEKIDWSQSWLVKTVNEAEWKTLKESLHNEYQQIMALFKSTEDWNDDQIGGAMAIIAHTAYHNGAIRQILKAIL